MNEVINYVAGTVLQIMTFFFVLRFLLQACRVDFYNPISQGIVKTTDIFLRPLRVVIPGYKNLDLPAFLAAVVANGLGLATAVAAGAMPPLSIGLIISNGVLSVILLLVFVIRWSILIAIIASWIAPGNRHPILALLNQVTEPVLAPARRLLPPLGGLDLSPIIIFLILGVIERVLPQFFESLFR